MALKLIVAPRAQRDLADILDFISMDDPLAANRLLLRIEKVCRLLVERPFLGPAVRLPKPADLRKMTVAPYLVFYRVKGDELQIARVLHSSRDHDDERFFAD